jgi:Flp pilus assembly protein CpaB
MNRTRLLMIGILALALGTVVSLLVYKNLLGKGPSSEPGTDVIVAAEDIQVGARIEDPNIRVARFSPSGLPAGTFPRKSQVLGRGVIIPIAKG